MIWGRDRGLVGHWKLDETSATTTAVDSSVNANDGTMDNMDGTTNTVTGKIDTGLEFNGTDEFIALPDAIPDGHTEITFATWFYSSGFSTTGFEDMMVQKKDTGTQSVVHLIHDHTNSWIAFLVRDNGDLNTVSTIPDASYDLDTWNHIAGTYDGSNTRIYLNGVEIDSDPQTGTIFNTDANIGLGNNWRDNIYPAGLAGGAWFDGRLDDTRVYLRALSAEEIRSLVENYTPGCSNPLGPEGAAIYNDDFDVMQFCNDNGWQAMGPNGDGGAGCTNPTGAQGDMIYNDDNNVMQYCEGDTWQAIGK